MIDKQHNQLSFGIGVDIGGTKILIMIMDNQGNIIFREKVKTSNNIKEIIEIIKTCISKVNIDLKNIVGMGIGIPGRVDSQRGFVIEVPSLGWENMKFKSMFEEHFNFPIYIKNDVNYSVIGERWLGNGKNKDDIFYISIGTGVGSAIIANGKIIEGYHFSAGEIAYLLEKEDVKSGRQNTFNDFGVFEKKTSGTALTEQGKKLNLTAKELFIEYKKNNPVVVPIIEEFILEISIVIANVVSLLNPESVIIGGGVSESMKCLIDKIIDTVSKLTPMNTNIELSKLGGDAGAIGASSVTFQNFRKK